MKKKNLIIAIVLFATVSISSTAQQVHDPEPCGNGWLCGAAMARVNIEAGHLSGLSIGNTGGSISTGTQYSTFFCCAASSALQCLSNICSKQ